MTIIVDLLLRLALQYLLVVTALAHRTPFIALRKVVRFAGVILRILIITRVHHHQELVIVLLKIVDGIIAVYICRIVQ